MGAQADARTTIVDALLVGFSAHEGGGESPAGFSLMGVNSVGMTVTLFANRDILLQTDATGNIDLDTYKGGSGRGNLNLLAGTSAIQQFGLNPLTPGTSQWAVFNAETGDYMLACNGLGTLELNEQVDYVTDGDELWRLLSDAIPRRIYLAANTSFSLPAGSGTRTVTASKTVIGLTSEDGTDPPVIDLPEDDYLRLEAYCEFENVKFTDSWSTPPAYLVACVATGGWLATFRNCIFAADTAPSTAVLFFQPAGGDPPLGKFVVEDCTFGGGVTAVPGLKATNGLKDCVIRGCLFRGSDKAIEIGGINATNVLIEGNSFNDRSGAGVQIDEALTDCENLVIRNNRFYRTDLGTPSPVLRIAGTGKKVICENYFRTNHSNAATWGANFLVELTGGDIQFVNNEIRGAQMNQTASGLVLVSDSIASLLCQGNHFRGGAIITKLLVLDSVGTSGAPSNIQINDNQFTELAVADATYIKIQDQTAGTDPRASLGTISNNVFTGPNGVAIRAIDCDAGADDEATGFAIIGNVMNETVQIYQTPFRTSIFRNNINTGSNDPVTPTAAAGNNLVGDNLPVP